MTPTLLMKLVAPRECEDWAVKCMKPSNTDTVYLNVQLVEFDGGECLLIWQLRKLFSSKCVYLSIVKYITADQTHTGCDNDFVNKYGEENIQRGSCRILPQKFMKPWFHMEER